MQKTSIETYKELKQKLTLNKDDQKFLDFSKSQCQNIFFKKNSKKLIIFAGPCSIHDEKQALLYAKKLKNLQKNLKNIFLIMRVYFEKPRSQSSWTGFLYDPKLNNSFNIGDGLNKTRKLLIEITKTKIPIATEIVDPNVFFYFDDLVTWSFIGARTSASQLHRNLASSLAIPVGFKNALDGDVSIAINASIIANNKQNFISLDENGKICKISSDGNKFSHIVLRGSKMAINYDEKSLDNILKLMNRKNHNFPIVIDVSHGNSNYNHLNQIKAFKYTIDTIMKKKYPIIGIMLESNLKAGKQKLTSLNLRFGQSITDSCMDFETTKDLILLADEKLNAHEIDLAHLS